MKKKKKIQLDPMLYAATNWPRGFMAPELLDPLGSYTGVPADPTETPVQDADDL